MVRSSLLLATLLFVVGCGSAGSSSLSSDVSSINSSTGQGGSRAQYAIVGDYLYMVNEGVMDILDVSDASNPTRISKVHLPWDVETLHAYKNYLYIGAESGVYIYDNSTPTQPTQIAAFSHIQSCDPVVVSDDIAYVTLNSGNGCWNNRTGTNRLEVLNVQDPTNPVLIKTLDMWEPTGLGVDEDKLFICDGDAGLKTFEIIKSKSEENLSIELNLLSSNTEINCYDVIAHNDALLVSNGDDVRQFDYSSLPMEELGNIK